MRMGTTVKVSKLPSCDFCLDKSRLAKYDARTTWGTWANLCEFHFNMYTSKELGTGRGQELVVRGTK